VPDEITIPMVLDTLKSRATRLAAGRLPPQHGAGQKAVGGPAEREYPPGLRVEILLPRQVAKNRIMGRRLCKNNNNHPNNIFIDAIKPSGDKCRVCGGDLTARSDDQDEAAINKRHDIYYNDKDGTLAAAYFFKDLAAQGKTKYIELNGEGSIDSIKETLLSKLA
jgi:adenylate kinase